jgi:hypothetical protein
MQRLSSNERQQGIKVRTIHLPSPRSEPRSATSLSLSLSLIVVWLTFILLVQDLYYFKSRHPDIDIQPYLATATTQFQTYVRRALMAVEEKENLPVRPNPANASATPAAAASPVAAANGTLRSPLRHCFLWDGDERACSRCVHSLAGRWRGTAAAEGSEDVYVDKLRALQKRYGRATSKSGSGVNALVAPVSLTSSTDSTTSSLAAAAGAGSTKPGLASAAGIAPLSNSSPPRTRTQH